MTRRILAPGALAGTLTRWLIAGLFGLSAFPVSDVHAASCKQPVYIIAHRCNDPNDGPQTVAAEGVNAIEADFSWGSRWPGITDDEWAVDHEGVYPHSTYLSNWLTDVSAEVHTPGTTLSLIIFDIKDPEGDLLLLYKEARKALGPDINLIFSIGSYGGREEFKNIRDVINADQRAGVALDQNTSPSAAADFFKNAPINKYWFGDGIAAGALEPDSVQFHTFAAMGIRDSEADCSAFHGVYTWTYEEEDRVKFYLDHGVNGIFVNAPTCNGYANPGGPEVIAPKDVVAYAKNLPNRKFATPEDNPFEYVKPEIFCPVSATIECSSPGGAKATDPQASSFLNGATCDNENCDTVTISNNGAAFFPVNSATPVTFTATADSPCSPTGQCQATLTVKDTTAPTPTCPADIALDPMTPQGSVATFSVSAADVCDVAAQVTCDRASGSTFGIGTTTTVTCTAKDASNNTQSCSFSVKVKTPQEVVNDLKATAASLSGSLNNGQMNSLMSLLDALLASINASNTSSTCGQLLGLISNINGWVTNGALSAAQAKPFIDSAKNLQKTFGCT